MTRIAIASCCKLRWQKRQPAWTSIMAARPDLLLLLGDTVYMRSEHGWWDHADLEDQYRRQFAVASFKTLTDTVPFMATWDDHDFGPNDARGAEVEPSLRNRSRALFHKYMKRAVGLTKPEVYCTHDIGDIRVIMLDVRFYRETADPKRPAATLLGRRQEQWLWRQLDHGKKYTVIGAGSTLGGTEKAETWQSYTEFYARFLDRIARVRNVMVVSGDIHRNKFTDHGGFFEVTSSGVGRPERKKKPRGAPMNNYGIIDFGADAVDVALHGRLRRDKIRRRIVSADWSVS